MQDSRLILYHKQAASGLTRFVRLDHGGVAAFEPLPVPSMLLDEAPAGAVVTHPAKMLSEAESRLGLPAGGLEIDSDFHAWVDVANGPVEFYLARFTDLDAPFKVVEAMGAEFINLTDGRQLVQAELEMLRLAYECVMED